MPIFGLGVLILWLGWFGFNAGSTLGTSAERFAEVAVVTQLAAAAGVLGASIDRRCLNDEVARRRHGRQRRDRRPRRHHRAVGLRRVLGGADHRRRRRRDRRRLRLRDRQASSTTRSARSRRTASRASGARWRAASSRRRGWRETRSAIGKAACSRAAGSSSWACRRPRSSLTFVTVFALSFAHVLAIKATYRAPRQRRGGGSRAGHRRARHVRVSGAVHPRAGARRLLRALLGRSPSGAGAHTKEVPAS